MSDMLSVNPTRGNLLRLKGELESIRSRHGLLDRKRRILVQELMKRLEKAERKEEEGEEVFRKARFSLREARMRVGLDRIEGISLSPTVGHDVRIESRSVMGLKLPRVEMEFHPEDPPYSLSETSAYLDEARRRWQDVLTHLADAAEAVASVWRLAMALRKTQRLVNALGHVIIPRYEKTIAHIEEVLEEEERQEVMQARMVKEGR